MIQEMAQSNLKCLNYVMRAVKLRCFSPDLVLVFVKRCFRFSLLSKCLRVERNQRLEMIYLDSTAENFRNDIDASYRLLSHSVQVRFISVPSNRKGLFLSSNVSMASWFTSFFPPTITQKLF